MSLWSCPTCFKSFARKGDLTRHQLIHSGIKPHVCETCGKGFTQSSGLRTHQNTHSMAKPYKCGIGSCKKAFGDPSSCSRHRKETHRREGAYKCIVAGCGTRIKRRSAFVSHLRKHGLDPKSIDLDTIASESNEGEIPAPAHFASSGSDAENKSHDIMESTSASPTSLGSGYYTLDNGDEATHLAENNRQSNYPPDTWSAGNYSMLLDPMLDQTIDTGPSGLPSDTYTFPSGNFENPSYFDRMLSELVDSPLLGASSLYPLLEPLVEARSDESQSSPSSMYSTLYTANFDDVLGLSLATSAPQEQLYSTFYD